MSKRTRKFPNLLLPWLAAGLAGCLNAPSAPTAPPVTEPPPATDPSGGNAATGGDGTGVSAQPGGTAAPSQPATPAENQQLAARSIDYGEALRTAALKLVGTIPTLDEQAAVTDATSYAAQLDKYFADPRFAVQMRQYFRNMMKMGGTLPVVSGNTTKNVSLDTAPTFAAEVVVKGRPITDLFTAATATCPTLSTAGVFTDATCAVANGLTTSGVLTDPGVMAQFYSNMAFRRVRWVQETFVCTRFPTEFSSTPTPMGSGEYVSPWPFTSIAGGAGAQINFQDTSSVVCANCHSTMNHIAPLFAQFDPFGAYQTSIQVHTPTPAAPVTVLADWLPAGQQSLSWRYQTAITNLTDLGTAMSKDPDVTGCQVVRAWNWAMSKTDVVNDLAVVPASVITSYQTQLASGGYQLQPVLKAMLTSDDFVKF